MCALVECGASSLWTSSPHFTIRNPGQMTIGNTHLTLVELIWVCPVRWCDVRDYQSLLVTSWPWTSNIGRANCLSQAHSMRIVGFLHWRRSHEGKPCWAHFFMNSNTDSGSLEITYSRLWFLFSEITCWTSPEGRSWVQKAPCSTCQGRQGKEEGKKTIIPLQIC